MRVKRRQNCIKVLIFIWDSAQGKLKSLFHNFWFIAQSFGDPAVVQYPWRSSLLFSGGGNRETNANGALLCAKYKFGDTNKTINDLIDYKIN